MKKNRLFILRTAAVLLAFGAVLAGCGGKNQAKVQEQLEKLAFEARDARGRGDTAEAERLEAEILKLQKPEPQAAKAEKPAKESAPKASGGGAAKLAAESDFEVGLTKDGQGAVIKKYVCNGGAIIIPATIQGMPVREVTFAVSDESWTKKTRNLYTSPNVQRRPTFMSKDVIEKNNWVYEGEEPNPNYRPEYRAITSIVIPEGVTRIGDNAFNGCTSLASVTIPNSVTRIGRKAFEDCTSLASVTIPNSVTTIGDYAFSGCTSLASVTIPNSVTTIGDDAFAGCTSLASVTIPNSATIGDFAFMNSGLTSVTIPDSVTYIGRDAFRYCSNLVTVTFSPKVPGRKWDPSGNKGNRSQMISNKASWVFQDCPKLDLKTQALIKAEDAK